MSDMTFNIAWVQKNTETLDKVAGQLDLIGNRLDALDRKKADPKVSVDTTEANAKLDDLSKKIDKLKVSQVGAGIFGGIAGAGAIAGASLLVIPAAITAIGIEAEKTNPQVVAAFTNMTAAAKQTMQVGFSPLVPALTQFAGEAQNALGTVKGQLAESAVAAAPLLSIVGTDFIKATEQGIGASVPIIQSLRPVAQAAGDDIVKVEQGVMGFLGKLDAGPAAQGLSELGTDVQNLLPPIGTLVNDIVPLGNDLLNVVGPALTDTANAAHLLAAPLQLVGSTLSFFGPAIGATVPLVLALAGGTKLLTGSWTDFAGAGSKLIGPIQNYDSTLTSLGSKIGITTAAQNADNKITAEAVLVRAQLAKQTAEAAALEAAFAAEEAGTAEAELAAVAAADELAASEVALAEAQTAAATTAEGLTFSLGPIGLILGAAAGAAALFGFTSGKTSTEVGDLSQQIIQLGTATPSAAASMVSGSTDLQRFSDSLGAVGSSAQQFAQSFGGSAQHAKQYIDNLADSQQRLGASSINAQKLSDVVTQGLNRQDAAAVMGSKNIAQLANAVNGSRDAYNALNPSLKAQVVDYNAYNEVIPQAKNALSDMKAAQAAEAQTLAQEGIVLDSTTKAWNGYGLAVAQRSTDFNTATAGIKGVTDNLLAADSGFFQAKANFAQLDAAVGSAEQAVQQASVGIANAQHSVQQASLGVTQARQGEAQAVVGVTTAEDQLAKANQSEAQSVANLNVVRQQQIQTLKDLQRQVIDQADTEAEAQLRLLDAQTAVDAAGLKGKSLSSLGGPTAANEANYKLLLTLQEAQHSLNDTTDQGQKLAAQNAAAQALGVDGSSSVIAAQQQIVQAQQQAKQAAQALAQAQQGVLQASQSVANAQWSEKQASAAVGQASQAQHAASVALAQAKADDSRNTDINTAAGVRNRQTIEQLFEANFTATGDINQATQATEAQGRQMGITKGSVDDVITSLTKIPLTTPFSIVGTPSLNLTALVQQASAQGISPFSLGLPSGDVQLAVDTAHGKAAGGLISGPGTGTSDSILAFGSGGPLRVSNGEYVVRADQTAKNLGLLEAINSGSYPGFASGGQVDAKSLLGVNYRLAGWDGFLQGTSSILQAFGKKTPNLPVGSGAIDFGNIGVRASGASGTLGSVAAASGSAAQAQAYAQSIMGNYGWGPEQWIPWLKLGNEESGWNANAVNASSGAYGIGQALGHGHPYALGDYANQVVWMANYIKGRYGNPAAAWAFETSHVPNWYRDGGIVDALKAPKVRDHGGPIDPGWNAVFNGTGRPETSRSGAQEDALLNELRELRRVVSNLAPVNVHPPASASVDEIYATIERRQRFKGR